MQLLQLSCSWVGMWKLFLEGIRTPRRCTAARCCRVFAAVAAIKGGLRCQSQTFAGDYLLLPEATGRGRPLRN
jgi:hypothetical protein